MLPQTQKFIQLPCLYYTLQRSWHETRNYIKKHKCSLQFSQKPATGPCHEEVQSKLHLHLHCLYLHDFILILPSHIHLGFQSFFWDFLAKTVFLISAMISTCPIPINYITLTISEDKSKVWNLSLCNILHSSATSSFTGPNKINPSNLPQLVNSHFIST